MFDAELDPDLPDGKYNVAPTDPIGIVLTDDRRRVLTRATWGFRPSWRLRAGAPRPGWINAKAETAAESPAFGRALRRQRCMVPADAFYEWDRSHRPPQPYAIGGAGGEPLALAGLWTQTKGGEFITAAILTTRPNRQMEGLHHRMPVILERDQVDTWLAPEAALDDIAQLLEPAPDDSLEIWPVSTAVNSVRNDGPELLRPVEGVPASLGLV